MIQLSIAGMSFVRTAEVPVGSEVIQPGCLDAMQITCDCAVQPNTTSVYALIYHPYRTKEQELS